MFPAMPFYYVLKCGARPPCGEQLVCKPLRFALFERIFP